MTDYGSDPRVVLTLDAGGSNFRFSAMSGGRAVTPMITVPSQGDDLDRCLEGMVEQFRCVKIQCARPPVAISFAFPAPADYSSGIIGRLNNLPAFRGEVALGPMLEDEFGIPVWINNDADLFTHGEAMAGLLPYVNGLLEKAGSPRRYRNLFGVTLGTGFGGGIVRDGKLFAGDNSMAGEIWAMRNKLDPGQSAEEGVSIRAVRKVYAARAGIAVESAPDPREIAEIAEGKQPGDRAAALEAYRRLGEVAGDSLAHALTLVDGLAVIGGGLAQSHRLFFPALLDELNGRHVEPGGALVRRLTPRAFDLEDPEQLDLFLKGDRREIAVPRSGRKLVYEPLQRLGVGISRLGTSEATALGAYVFALQKLDENGPESDCG